MYKTSDNKALTLYIQDYRLLDTLTDFTIYFWQKSVISGTILTFDNSIFSFSGTAINNSGIGRQNTSGGANYTKIGTFSPDTSIWSFCEYTFKQSSSSNYIVTCFYQGEKKFSVNLDIEYLKKPSIILGNWSFWKTFETYGFTGYIYDLSIYDEILHTENYNEFPEKEMNYKSIIGYVGMEKENNLYGII